MLRDDFLEILKQRKEPGMIILNSNKEVVFFNEEAFNIIPNLNELPMPIKKLFIKSKNGILTTDNGVYFLRKIILKNYNGNSEDYFLVLIEKIRKGFDFEKIKTAFNLSKREIEVIKLLYDGLSNKEIADKLYLSEYTVKDHFKSIMKKLNVSSRSKILARLINHY